MVIESHPDVSAVGTASWFSTKHGASCNQDCLLSHSQVKLLTLINLWDLVDIEKLYLYTTRTPFLVDMTNNFNDLQAGVFGIPDEKIGEVCVALVVRRDGGDVGEKELVTWVNNNLVEEWRKIGGVKFVKELPHGSMGKKQRRKMKEVWLKTMD